ncbi:serine hydrolase domain-containing protein [Paenibacillus sp. NPDC058174]|uniref:serine hydrolase domain-containing protein n=1 Tax=Paenibacillus sp. NPDC058174 TaxID=3346366 RepID=UPI0036DB0AF8
MDFNEIVKKHNQEENQRMQFSGAILFRAEDETKFENSYGFANRSDKIKNRPNTRFGIASGSKIFTAIAICQLVQKGLLEFDTKLCDLELNLNQFDPTITVHHLLTHTSGIPDYFDEEFMSDYESLWKTVPMYNVNSPKSFLPLFRNNPMKFEPGTQFSYSNAGFIVLGLIVEKLTGLSFNDYVEENIFRACEMNDSGYYHMNQLPERTAIGYVGNDDNWKTNIYSIPIVGGPDGGAYTTVYDLSKFWSSLMKNQLLSKSLTERILSPHVQDSEFIHYGYGVWITMINNEIFKYFVMGGDPGVVMQSSYYPEMKAELHVLANVDRGAGLIATRINEVLLSK